jgi:hypothetical protein
MYLVWRLILMLMNRLFIVKPQVANDISRRVSIIREMRALLAIKPRSLSQKIPTSF